MKIKSLLVVAIVATAILFSTGIVYAQTTSAQTALTQQLIQLLTKMIAQLEQEIQQILAQQHTTTPSPTSILQPTSAPTTGWQTYTNTQYNFSFEYPANMTLNPYMEDSSEYISRVCSSSTDCSAQVGIKISTIPSVVASCMSAPQTQSYQGEPTYSTTTINGKNFMLLGSAGAGGGSTTAINTYQTLWGNACYIIESQLTTPSNSITDPTLTQTLNFIIQSFQFTSLTPPQLSAETATINQNSLTSNSGNPTITGASNNATALEISIMGSDGQYVYWSPQIPVTNHTWSATISSSSQYKFTSLKSGTYTINVLDWNAGNTGTPLTTGTLTIANQGTISNGVIFTSTPTSGNAPLQVEFSGQIDFATYGNGPFVLDFGESQYVLNGTVIKNNYCSVGLTGTQGSSLNYINPEYYTYHSPGTYTAELRKGINCSGQAVCCTPGDIIASVNVTVK